MKQLPVVSVSDASDKWLLAVQNAIINTNGVFAISGLHADLTWEEACKISKKTLKIYMRAAQCNPYELHRGLDLDKGQGRSTSCLRKGDTEGNLEDHIDKGLFNIVVGDIDAMRGLQFQNRNGEYESVLQKIFIHLSDRSVFALVIPGYTLQFFEPGLSAARHRVLAMHKFRTTQVFQCRLDPHYKVNGEEIGRVLAHTFSKSVRGTYTVTVRHLDGKNTYLEVTSATSLGAFKEMYCLVEGHGDEERRFISAGKWLYGDERLLSDDIALDGQPIIYVVPRLIGD